ncbi:hypothetical protein [Lysobacter enzymogenes]|uniref:hypothetical protein n=1 Tax=Lysobacter enzymogenes TaxID=69 RepID=UPI00089D175E|nr:hypothetical protein [Lysobacter enzymogenes]SDW94821.1 hypothetical protein SAMN05421681_103307 [Lysobacter enzymogenes]
MEFTAIKNFPHDRLGQIEKGARVPVTEKEGERLRMLGLVEYATKVVRHKPVEPDPVSAPPSAAAGEPSSASPAAQASAPPTSPPFEPGETAADTETASAAAPSKAAKKAAKKTTGSKKAAAE